MQTKKYVFGAACALLLVGAGVRAEDKPVTLARTVKAGDSTRQKVTITASLGGMDFEIVQTNKTAVKEITKKGDIVWAQTSEEVIVNGTPQTEGVGVTRDETRDKLNKLVEFKPIEGGMNPFPAEVQKLMASVSEILLPDKPVKAGDSWTTEFDNPVVKDKKVTTKTTFVGMDKVDGKEYWKLKQTTTADADKDGGKTSNEMTAWLDPADGSTFKMEASIKDVPSQLGPLSFTMKLEKAKAKADKAEKP